MCVPEAYCANLPVKLVACCKHSSGADAVTAHRSCLALQIFFGGSCTAWLDCCCADIQGACLYGQGDAGAVMLHP
jgi:hypothetical protein